MRFARLKTGAVAVLIAFVGGAWIEGAVSWGLEAIRRGAATASATVVTVWLAFVVQALVEDYLLDRSEQLEHSQHPFYRLSGWAVAAVVAGLWLGTTERAQIWK